jgi:predicted metal-binding protein
MHASFAAFAIKMPVIDPLVNAAYYYHHRFHESSCFLCKKCKHE